MPHGVSYPAVKSGHTTPPATFLTVPFANACAQSAKVPVPARHSGQALKNRPLRLSREPETLGRDSRRKRGERKGVIRQETEPD